MQKSYFSELIFAKLDTNQTGLFLIARVPIAYYLTTQLSLKIKVDYYTTGKIGTCRRFFVL